MNTLEQLLRHPEQVIARCRKGRELESFGRAALGAIVAGGAAFGAAVGAFRGGRQILFAATKIPLATVVTLGVCAPALYALGSVFGRRWPLRTVVAIALGAAARSALVLLALAPVLWLAIDLGTPYPLVKLLATLAYALGGLSALSVAVRALGDEPGRRGCATAFVALFLLVGGQTGWVLRPYLGRPEDPTVPFIVRTAEDGGLPAALWRSTAALLGPPAGP